MTSRKRTRRGVHPAVAVGLLVVAIGVFANNVLPLVLGKPRGGGATSAVVAPPAAPVGETAPPTALPTPSGRADRDLLAEFGSFDTGQQVHNAFHRPSHDVAAQAAAAAAAAAVTAPVPQPGDWQGPAPAPHRLTFVMIGAPCSRAVVDGRVVGIDEVLAEGRIVGIGKDHVRLQVGERTLTYDLRDEWPREYREERQRRLTETEPNRTPAGTPRSKS